MKKAENVQERRKLKRLLFRNYMVISALMLITIVLCLFGADFLVNKFFDKSSELTRIQGEDIYRYPFDNIQERWLDEYGGWIEIVDESGDVIFTKGNKEDDIVSYSRDQLYTKMDFYRNDDGLFYHVYNVQGPQGESYVLLWKIPERLGLYSAYVALAVLGGLLIIFLFIAIYVYSWYSVRQFKKPLKQIVDGIREMERFNYTKRLDFSAEQEFAEIREAFNKMAERLQRTSDEKEAAENNKRNMLLHLSHDLKTPITSILGFSLLLMDNQELEDSQKQKYIQYINQKSSYMANLIQDLFELAKFDDHHLILNMEQVNMTEWFRQLVAECYPELENKGFILNAQIPEERLLVKLDKMHMNRVVANLIGNALKYNPAGTVLSASCEKKDRRIVIWIGDNGVGIQDEIRENIFDEFIRGTDSAKGSTGVGLAICKKIVMLHQGNIELIPDEGYSTLFKISLPYVNMEGHAQ